MKALKKVRSDVDLVWVDSGELLGPKVLKAIKSRFQCPVVLYNVDDPTGPRDGQRFRSLRVALRTYDHCVTVRKETLHELIQSGAKSAQQVFRSYDEVMHAPYANPCDIPQEFISDIAFIGTWIRYEGRDDFLCKLLDAGLSIAIWGDRWRKAPNWQKLKSCYRGGALSGSDYVAAIQGAKICLGLLSKGNRDLHTQRSAEVPYANGLLCAERTSEHLQMYEDGVSAVFWNGPGECIQVCKSLLECESRRKTILASGAARVRELRIGNEDVVRSVLDRISASTLAIQ